jgi:hypothetical protein
MIKSALFCSPFHICIKSTVSLDGGSAHRKAVTYTENNIQKIKEYRHPCLDWDSNS